MAHDSDKQAKKSQDFLEKKKEETKKAAKAGKVDTSKMPEGLRKHFEKKGNRSKSVVKSDKGRIDFSKSLAKAEKSKK